MNARSSIPLWAKMSSLASTGNATENQSTSSTAALSHDQWLVILGVALLVGSYLFRLELVRFTLKLLQRMMPPHLDVWFKEFEKTLQLPLSWVVFVLFMWLSMIVMDMSSLLGIDSDTLASIVSLIIGIPLIWVVIAFCNYVTWVRTDPALAGGCCYADNGFLSVPRASFALKAGIELPRRTTTTTVV